MIDTPQDITATAMTIAGTIAMIGAATTMTETTASGMSAMKEMSAGKTASAIATMTATAARTLQFRSTEKAGLHSLIRP